MTWHSQEDAISGETLLTDTTAQGLKVMLVPRPGLSQMSAVLAVDYGSIDDRFAPPGQKRNRSVPSGIAHFLEHKMFEKEEGDLSERFARKGAQANAATGHRMTGYLFSCTTDFFEHLETLFEITCRPYFTEKSVQKEQGIIDQEIRSYDDSPGWRTWRAMLEGLYWKHPARKDIAGTSKSIREIDADLLKLCHQSFYVPQNMVLTLAGDLAMDEVMPFVQALVARHYGNEHKGIAMRAPIDEPAQIRKAHTKLKMAVSMPRLAIGFKGPLERLKPRAMLELDAALTLFLDAVLSDASAWHEDLFARGLLTEDFNYSATAEPGIVYAYAGGQTNDPEGLSEAILSAFERALKKPLDPLALEGAKRRALGEFIRTFDNPDALTWIMAECHFQGLGLFDWPGVIEAIDEKKIRRLAAQVFRRECATRVDVLPTS